MPHPTIAIEKRPSLPGTAGTEAGMVERWIEDQPGHVYFWQSADGNWRVYQVPARRVMHEIASDPRAPMTTQARKAGVTVEG